MEIPKVVSAEKALEYVKGQIDQKSENWAMRLCEKLMAEKGFETKEFTASQTANYEKLTNVLEGKDQKTYQRLFYKFSAQEKDDYVMVSSYKISEGKISTAVRQMEMNLDLIEAATTVKELIEASIPATKE